jgi:hypothetical protein
MTTETVPLITLQTVWSSHLAEWRRNPTNKGESHDSSCPAQSLRHDP